MKIAVDKLARRRAAGNGGSPKPPDAPGQRRLRLGYRARSIGLAALLALAAVVLTVSYVRSYKRSVEGAAASASVLVATRDIPAGTPGSALVDRGLAVEKALPRRALEPGALSQPARVAGLVTGETIYVGEQVTVRQFRPAAQRGLHGELNGTERAIAVPGDPNQLLVGIVRTGDSVDVIATVTAGEPARAVSRVILRGIAVLRAPEQPAEGARSGPPASAVLALTDRQAQKLFYAMKHGTWSLLLRPAGRAADSVAPGDDAGSVAGLTEVAP